MELLDLSWELNLGEKRRDAAATFGMEHLDLR